MDKNSKPLVISIISLIVLLVLLGLSYVCVRNSLITKDENTRAAWGQVEAQLQRRADLIPNLVATVKKYAEHEEEVFSELAEARAALMASQGKGVDEVADADERLTLSLGRLLMLSENYPELKSNENFLKLQDELAGTENRITVARTRYNESVRVYNASIRRFPGYLFADDLDLEPADYFNASAERPDVEKAPTLDFD